MRLSLMMMPVALMAAPLAAEDLQKAVFAGGCFWCVESDFESVKGVKEVVSGYTGGTRPNPNYKSLKGHIEAVEITYDSTLVSYEDLVHKFFRSIDPTDAGGQFCDRGNAYTTAVFALNPEQEATALAQRDLADSALEASVVTPVKSAGKFYPAENYHQDYYKSSKIVISRFGPVKKSVAYKKYRDACGRDEKVKALWGDDAAFLN